MPLVRRVDARVPHRRRLRRPLEIAVIHIEIVVTRHVVRLLGPLQFVLVFANDHVLNHLAARRVDGVRNVGVKFRATIGVQRHTIGRKSIAALIAELRTEVVLHAAARAMRRELATRHGDEGAAGPLDDFQIPHDKAIVERDGAERLQSFAGLLHEFDADLGDFHGCSPCEAVTLAAGRGGEDGPQIGRCKLSGDSPRVARRPHDAEIRGAATSQ